jgi:hypothetical protein
MLSCPSHTLLLPPLVFLRDQVQNKSILMYQQDRYFQQGMQQHGHLHGYTDADPSTALLSAWPPTPPPFSNLPRFGYVLTAPRADVLSRTMQLNGKLLEVSVKGTVTIYSTM